MTPRLMKCLAVAALATAAASVCHGAVLTHPGALILDHAAALSMPAPPVTLTVPGGVAPGERLAGRGIAAYRTKRNAGVLEDLYEAGLVTRARVKLDATQDAWLYSAGTAVTIGTTPPGQLSRITVSFAPGKWLVTGTGAVSTDKAGGVRVAVTWTYIEDPDLVGIPDGGPAWRHAVSDGPAQGNEPGSCTVDPAGNARVIRCVIDAPWSGAASVHVPGAG
ncbi:MAG TPA: hypothetical protein VF265_02085 [Nevskiaceae bacterium]